MKDISGYEQRYAITEDGKVWSYLSNRFLIPLDSGKGYLYVNLIDQQGNRKSKKIHRIVAETFIPNPNNLPCVNHKDENKNNNSINNLEWCDYHYNNTYGDRLEKIKEKNLNKESISCKIIGTNIKTQEKIEFPSIREAARFLGNENKSSNIVATLNGRQKTAYGYLWERVDF